MELVERGGGEAAGEGEGAGAVLAKVCELNCVIYFIRITSYTILNARFYSEIIKSTYLEI